MLLAHIADPHNGYRAYHRLSSDGVNQREADVDRAFGQAIDLVADSSAELLLIAGDVFHTVRPSNAAISRVFRRLANLRERRPKMPILLLGGNHDSPKASGTGNILKLFEEIPGVLAVTHASQQVYLEALDCSVLCVPYNDLATGLRTSLEPDPKAGTNILMLHGTVGGDVAQKKIRYLGAYGGELIEDKALGVERWDYVALGHYHLLTELAPNMWYPGALERTSTNIWIETGPKGFLFFDTETQKADFAPVESRRMLDLPPLDAANLTASAIDAEIAQRVEAVDGGIDEAIVRQVVHNLPRHVAGELDHQALRDYRARALHFRFDPRRPVANRKDGAIEASERPPLKTVEEEFANFIENEWKPSTPDIRMSKLLALGTHYMEAEEDVA